MRNTKEKVWLTWFLARASTPSLDPGRCSRRRGCCDFCFREDFSWTSTSALWFIGRFRWFLRCLAWSTPLSLLSSLRTSLGLFGEQFESGKTRLFHDRSMSALMRDEQLPHVALTTGVSFLDTNEPEISFWICFDGLPVSSSDIVDWDLHARDVCWRDTGK